MLVGEPEGKKALARPRF